MHGSHKAFQYVYRLKCVCVCVCVCVCSSGNPADFRRLAPQQIASKSHPYNCAAQRRGMKRYAPMISLSLSLSLFFFTGVRISVTGPRGSYVNDVSPALWYANEVTNGLVTIFMAHLFAAYMVNFP